MTVDDHARLPLSAAIVAEALSWVGTPYRHQGSHKGVGCDCLGLVLGVWRAVHGEVPEVPQVYSADWAEASGEEQLLAAAKRFLQENHDKPASYGDVLLFRWRPHLPAKHAGILVGNDRFIHAYEGNAVTISALVPQWRRRIAGAFAFPDRSPII